MSYATNMEIHVWPFPSYLIGNSLQYIGLNRTSCFVSVLFLFRFVSESIGGKDKKKTERDKNKSKITITELEFHFCIPSFCPGLLEG
jgi:hypothetical protein